MAEPNFTERRKSNRDRRSKPGPRPPRFSILPLVALFFGLVLLNQFFAPARPKTIPYSELKNRISDRQVKEVFIAATHIEAVPDTTISKGDGPDRWRATLPGVEDKQLIELLEARNIPYSGVPAGRWGFLLTLLFPLLLIVLFWVFMFRRMNPTQGVLTVGKSKARIVGEEGTGVTFDDALARLRKGRPYSASAKRGRQDILRPLHDVERHLAPPDAAVALALEPLLADVQVERDIELPAAGEVLLDVLAGVHAINGRAEARAQKRVVQVLADDGVVAADDAEDVHPPGDLAVGQQGPAGHRAVPVAVEPAERQDRLAGERPRLQFLHPDAAEERQRQPQRPGPGHAAGPGLPQRRRQIIMLARMVDDVARPAPAYPVHEPVREEIGEVVEHELEPGDLGLRVAEATRTRGRDEARSIPEWAQTHPLTENRVRRARDAASAIVASPVSQTTSTGASVTFSVTGDELTPCRSIVTPFTTPVS